ncbi:MAG: DUF1566 domain-containing protein [Candidatus Electrothrix sp. AUS1_2]|nr:DUF1566 domain-containing protein [Candidatus Electrothrix sp. AUS1_2]
MPEKRYAILIASSEYSPESGLTRLRCPENDVRAVDEILRSPDFGNFTETFVFRNAPSYEILPRLNSVLADAGKDDLVLIYFSGHGKLNRLGHLCLTTVNTDSKALEATSIRASTIKSYFDLSYSRKKILLLDCCYSGAAGEEFARTRGGVNEELQLMSSGQGTFIMTASSGIQTAVEKEGDRYGLFTKHLVQGIRSGEADKDEDGFVDMQELYEYVHAKVREDGAQEPMKWDLHVKGKLVVSRSGKEAKKKRLQKIRQRLYELAAQGSLPDDIVAEAMRILAKEMLIAKEQKQYSLLEQLAAEKTLPADFIVQWVRIDFAGMKEPDMQEEENDDQEQVPLSAPDWGAICEQDVETVGKKIKLLLRFVFLAGLIVVIGWWSLKQWEYHPETKQAASSVPEAKTIGQYIDHGDGTVTDTKTDLMWKRCSEGLSGDNCEEGEVKRYNWDDAVKRFKDVKYAGYSDWRLPTVDELKALVYCSKGVKDKKSGWCNDGSEKPTINRQAFPNTAWWYRSGSPYAYYSDSAWYVDFDYGSSVFDSRSVNGAVRLVRGGQ